MCIYVYIKINRHTYIYMTQSAKRLTPDADAADRGLQSWTMWEYKTFCIQSDDPKAQDGKFGTPSTLNPELLLLHYSRP